MLVVSLLELAIWQRKPLMEAAERAARESEARRAAALQAKRREEIEASSGPAIHEARAASVPVPVAHDPATSAVAGPRSSTPVDAEVVRAKPPTIPAATQKRTSPPPERWASRLLGAGAGLTTLNAMRAQLPKDHVAFFGPGTVLNLDRGTSVSPLVYATALPQHGTFDASLINGSLPVVSSRCTVDAELPYWPSYHAATPQQRSRYLDWLVGERCDPNIEIGYVFIYFYGLERRILVDDADHEAVGAGSIASAVDLQP